jgi:GH15 family glucan-1,4-alpha-glucosidase
MIPASEAVIASARFSSSWRNESKALDACALLIPRVGFLPYDDERVVSTIETIS